MPRVAFSLCHTTHVSSVQFSSSTCIRLPRADDTVSEINIRVIYRYAKRYETDSVEQSTETNYLSKSKSNPPIFYLSKKK
jgi:hypothetical protein